MRAVGIRELKNKLSTYLRLVEQGERILVTDRDRVVAEIRAAEMGGLELADAELAALVRDGILRPPLTRETLPPRPRGTHAFDRLMRDLDVDRADR
jgi:antitoxin (DNA-binding transcriptional repressor) of toxin-antitoxin stability system